MQPRPARREGPGHEDRRQHLRHSNGASAAFAHAYDSAHRHTCAYGHAYAAPRADGHACAYLYGYAIARTTHTPLPTATATEQPTATPTAARTSLLSQTAPATARRATYNDPDGFFSLTYPKSWVQHRSGSEMQFWADEEGYAALAISLQIKAVSASHWCTRFPTTWPESGTITRKSLTMK